MSIFNRKRLNKRDGKMTIMSKNDLLEMDTNHIVSLQKAMDTSLRCHLPTIPAFIMADISQIAFIKGAELRETLEELLMLAVTIYREHHGQLEHNKFSEKVLQILNEMAKAHEESEDE